MATHHVNWSLSARRGLKAGGGAVFAPVFLISGVGECVWWIPASDLMLEGSPLPRLQGRSRVSCSGADQYYIPRPQMIEYAQRSDCRGHGICDEGDYVGAGTCASESC